MNVETEELIECANCQTQTRGIGGVCDGCGEQICIVCGCTDSAACPGGCFWTRPNICSQCDAAAAEDF